MFIAAFASQQLSPVRAVCLYLQNAVSAKQRCAALWFIRVYFSMSCVCVRHSQKNDRCLKIGHESDRNCPNFSNLILSFGQFSTRQATKKKYAEIRRNTQAIRRNTQKHPSNTQKYAETPQAKTPQAKTSSKNSLRKIHSTPTECGSLGRPISILTAKQ